MLIYIVVRSKNVLDMPGVNGYFTPLSVVFKNSPCGPHIRLPTSGYHYDKHLKIEL